MENYFWIFMYDDCDKYLGSHATRFDTYDEALDVMFELRESVIFRETHIKFRIVSSRELRREYDGV